MKIHENTRVTLTVGQIKRLIRESEQVPVPSPAQGGGTGSSVMKLAEAVKIIGNSQLNGQGIKLDSSARNLIENEVVKRSDGQIDPATAARITETTLGIVENPRFATIAVKVGKMVIRNNPISGPVIRYLIPSYREQLKNIRDDIKTVIKTKSLGKVMANNRKNLRSRLRRQMGIARDALKMDPFEKVFFKKALCSKAYWIALITFIATCISTGTATTVTAGAGSPSLALIIPAMMPLVEIMVSVAIEADAITHAEEMKLVRQQEPEQGVEPEVEVEVEPEQREQVAESLYRHRRASPGFRRYRRRTQAV